MIHPDLTLGHVLTIGVSSGFFALLTLNSVPLTMVNLWQMIGVVCIAAVLTWLWSVYFFIAATMTMLIFDAVAWAFSDSE